MSKVSGDASEDDPDECPSSGDNWGSKKNREKKRIPRRTSQRLRKKPRISHINSSDSDSEKIEIKKKGRNSISGRRRKSSLPSGMNIINKDFVLGGFLVLKKDIQSGDTTKQPCLWRIDGKALLQKYEAFDEQGKVLHRSTSVYTGWSPMDKDLYAPVSVQVQWHLSQQMVVELNWKSLREAMDSD